MPDPYDVLTIAAITDELRATIGNGRVQRIGLVDARTIGAEIYADRQRHYLIASADDRHPRLRLAAELPSLDPALITPFGQLLRKYARGGVILDIDQPPLERLVRFSIAKRHAPLKTRDEDQLSVPLADASAAVFDDMELENAALADAAPIVPVTLYVELMGRHSNLILVDEAGAILESAKRVTPAMSRVRTILPRLPYLPPPAPDRLDPRQANAAELQRTLEASPPDADLARLLVTSYRGISPQMAREIVFRAFGNDAMPSDDAFAQAAALARETRAIVDPIPTASWQPRLYRASDGDVVTFSAIPLAHLAAGFAEEPALSVSAAAAAAESPTHRATSARHAQRRQRLLDAVATARERAERRLAALAGELARAADVEKLRARGEQIYAHLWEIAPDQRELLVEGESIPLDPALSASENAQAYFARYRKAQGAKAQLPLLAAEGESELAYLDQLTTLIVQAPGFAELEALATEWAEQLPLAEGARPRRKAAPRRPRALVDAAGNCVYVGRSGPQNDQLTFDVAGPDDTWLHARGVGGSHVIVRWQHPGAPEDDTTIEAAAALAAWYSAARESGRVEVDVARRRHVRKIKAGRPGMVTYRNERTIRVRPLPEDRLRATLRER